MNCKFKSSALVRTSCINKSVIYMCVNLHKLKKRQSLKNMRSNQIKTIISVAFILTAPS